MFGKRDMKDSAIYRSYSKFIECNIIGNVAYERRYVVCIANAVIFVVLMNKQQNDNILETVLGTAKMLAEQTELDTEELAHQYKCALTQQRSDSSGSKLYKPFLDAIEKELRKRRKVTDDEQPEVPSEPNL